MRDIKDLCLTAAQSAGIRDALCARILEGLARPDGEIRALPAYLRRPSRDLAGEVVVLDAGGTNLRAARIRLDSNGARVVGGPVTDSALMRDARSPGVVDPIRFFQRQAELVSQVCDRKTFPLGYCFSYPAKIIPGGDAALLGWTKGIRIEGMEERTVGRGLREALACAGLSVTSMSVLNDTVASLLAGAWMAPEDRTAIVGLIVGTGTNMASFYPVRNLGKLGPGDREDWTEGEEMAVNLESGNFHPPCLAEIDREFDAEHTDHPGAQRFEKAVGGAYLPRLLGLWAGVRECRVLGFDPEAPGAHAGEVARLREAPGRVGEAAGALLDRSADMVAAALAGVLRSLGPASRRSAILAEGSLFWKTPGYRERVERTLERLLPSAEEFLILPPPREPDANFLGGACAALGR
jgi:hexokinase